ncbi:hypothetical protein Tco_1133979 [Tanacetum coccineum]
MPFEASFGVGGFIKTPWSLVSGEFPISHIMVTRGCSKLSFHRALDLIFKLDEAVVGCTRDILRQSDCFDRLSEIPWVVPTFVVIEGEIEILHDVFGTSGYYCGVLRSFPVERVEQGNEYTTCMNTSSPREETMMMLVLQTVSSLAVIVMSIDGKLPGKERKPMKADSDGINNTKIDHCVGMFAVYIGLGDNLYLSSGMGCFMDVNHDGLNANVANVVVRETLSGCINSSDDTAKPVQNGSINPKVVPKKDAKYRGCTDWY